MGSFGRGRVDGMGFKNTDCFRNHPATIGLCKSFGEMNCGGRRNWLRRDSSEGTSSRCFE